MFQDGPLGELVDKAGMRNRRNLNTTICQMGNPQIMQAAERPLLNMIPQRLKICMTKIGVIKRSGGLVHRIRIA